MHVECPFCHGRAHRHGRRRRYCPECRRSWVVRPRRRGPKPRRFDRVLLDNLLVGHATSNALARCFRTSATAVRQRCRVAMADLAARPVPTLPPGDEPCALLADGLWFTFKRQQSVLYNMALKPASADRAFLLEPVLIDGIELGRNWMSIIDALPPTLLSRVKALVSDGFRGSKRIADRQGWVHQRCNFHLIATLYGRQGRRRQVLASRHVHEWLYRCARAALVVQDDDQLAELCRMIRYWSEQPECPNRASRTARDFLRHREQFRTYLAHPELRLPRTVGAIDSLHRVMRRVVFGINNPQAMLRRVRAYIRIRPTITCRGHQILQK